MNIELRQKIVEHIFNNFAIIPSVFVSLEKSSSLKNPIYLLEEQIIFEEDDKLIKNKTWGCSLSILQQKIKVILGDCSASNYIKEYALLIKPEANPAYALYLIWDNEKMIASDALLACSVDDKSWLGCNTFLQATFLAAMEQTRDLGMSWVPHTNCKELYQSLLSFIEFRNKEIEQEERSNSFEGEES
jgi:hypothetical protein